LGCNWTIFTTQEAQRLEHIELYSISWEIMHCYSGDKREDKNPGIVSWIYLPKLKYLKIKNIDELSDISFKNQNFNKLEELYLENVPLLTDKFFCRTFQSIKKLTVAKIGIRSQTLMSNENLSKAWNS
jgi:hypothetical protein